MQEEENRPEEEEDPTAARSELSAFTPQSYAPGTAAADDEEDDVDIAFTGFDAPIDATAKYTANYGGAAQSAGQGHLVRPSAVVGARPQVAQLEDEWDFDGVEEMERRETEREQAAQAEPLEVRGRRVDADARGRGRGGSSTTTAPTFGVYRPRSTVSATETAIDDILSNPNLVGNVEEEESGGRRKKKKKK